MEVPDQAQYPNNMNLMSIYYNFELGVIFVFLAENVFIGHIK